MTTIRQLRFLVMIFVCFSQTTCYAKIDLSNAKDSLKLAKSPKKFVNFDLPEFQSKGPLDGKLVCLKFKYFTTDSDEARLPKIYLVNKRTNELCERLWSAKITFNRQKIYEELNLNLEILNGSVRDYQLQFRSLNSQDETSDQLSISDVLDVSSVNVHNDYCQTRYKCSKNDCLWSASRNQTQERSIIKLKNMASLSQSNLISQSLVQRLNLNLKDNNVYFVMHNKNRPLLNETIYSPVLKLPINLNEIEVSFDCKSLATDCLPNENVFVEYKFAEEYFNMNNVPKRLTKFERQIYKNKYTKFVFKLKAKDFIARQIDIVVWISIKLSLNQTLVLSNIEVKNFLSKDLEWKKCAFDKRSLKGLPCGLEQYNSFETNKVLIWSTATNADDKASPTRGYVKLVNDQSDPSFAPNELYLPRALQNGDNRDCVFRFKFNSESSDFNLFVNFVDDHKRQVKIWEKNEDFLMIENADSKRNWSEVSIYLGNIYQGFRLSFSVEQLVENGSIAIADLEFENCSHDPSARAIGRTRRPAELDIIRVSYEEPNQLLLNESSVYKCNFEHTTLEQCGLFQPDELLEETCPEETCTPSEWLISLDNFDGMTDFQLPFRDRSKNFATNGHYAYLQNMNSNKKPIKAILRLKRTLSNKSSDGNQCKLWFYLRTNNYHLVNYQIFIELMSNGKLVPIRTQPRYSKLNYYELNEVSFANITEPFQVLIQGSIRHNNLNENTFIYLAIDDLLFSHDCLFTV